VSYVGCRDEYETVVLASLVVDKIIISAMFAAFLVTGTILFLRRKKSH
jgi:hypothetical protein